MKEVLIKSIVEEVLRRDLEEGGYYGKRRENLPRGSGVM